MKRSSFSRMMGVCGMWLATTLAAGVMAPQAGFAQQPGDPFVNAALGPAVRIASPANHAVFSAPVDIPIFVFTRSEATFSNVDLYTNGVYLGSAASLGVASRPPPLFTYELPGQIPFAARFKSLWCLVWTDAPPANYVLTAVAKGAVAPSFPTGLLSRTSAPVNITVVASNAVSHVPDVVSIMATDPIAVAGTNESWVWRGLTNPVPAWTNWPPPRWGYFTNWGPKPALFAVRRYGDVTSNLSVNYNIGGTASNGVDYAALPGFVNIPGGEAYGLVPIVPIDNGSNNFIRTVILSLPPSTNVPPDYSVGVPKQAEAVIVYRWPWASPIFLGNVPVYAASALPDGTFHISTGGPDGAWFAVQSSPDLVNWTSIATNQVIQGSADFVDPGAAGNPAWFYQVVPVTNSPSQ